MLNAIKKLFGIKPAEPATEVPYKVEAPLVQLGPEPAVTEAVVVVADAVVPAAVVEVASAKMPPAKRGPAKSKAPVVKKSPGAPKKPRAPKAV